MRYYGAHISRPGTISGAKGTSAGLLKVELATVVVLVELKLFLFAA